MLEIEDLWRLWENFGANEINLGHTERYCSRDGFEAFLNGCIKGARENVSRIAGICKQKPKVVLDIGCSVGINALAFKEYWPDALVIGLDVELAALKAAAGIAEYFRPGCGPVFIQGAAEAIPLISGSVDGVVCLTVIEHVGDVRISLNEMSRVLHVDGFIYMEAPNYVWPFEPHLGVWCLPLLGKQSVAMAASIQGRAEQIGFLDHLNFVTPRQIEGQLYDNGLVWRDLTWEKIHEVMSGRTDSVRSYGRMANIMVRLGRSSLGTQLIRLFYRIRMYPSLMYLIKKRT